MRQMISSAWQVLVLFLIPIGGGIPAGVLLARNHGFEWPAMALLYLVSDMILALLFEPVMKLVALLVNRSPALSKFSEAMKKATSQRISNYGVRPGPFTLIMISFGVDPMTGRTAAFAAGHSFLSGWALAIAGDMIFFFVIMISTLCLDNILGDGTWTAIIIMVLMVGVPFLIRRFRSWRRMSPPVPR